MMLIFILLFGFTNESKANDIVVVDVRRNITLAEDDKVYKDFYINAGPASGLKKNLVVTAVRKINVRDASGANAVGEILAPVGQLKVIAVFDRVAVAREYTLLSRDELPMLEQVGIMSGDRIDLKGAFIDNSKPKPKPKLKTAQDLSTENSSNLIATTSTSATTATIITSDSTSTSIKTPLPTKALGSESASNGALPVISPTNPVVSAKPPLPASSEKVETLEKTADSGNNLVHE